MLQWGRSFSERRTANRVVHRYRAIMASMGPLFFRAENTSSADTYYPEGLLQWGRSFSERRTCPLSGPDGLCYVLQWGRSFSERRTPRGLFARIDQHHASMGPLFFRAENWALEAIDLLVGGFNGAALFQSGERHCIRQARHDLLSL